MEKSKVEVVVVPLPSQSHLNQLLHLAAVISSHGLPVHFVGSANHNRQAKLRAGLNPKVTARIHFHDLPTPPIASPEPNTTTLHKDPNHLAPAIIAYMELRDQIVRLVQNLSNKSRKTVVIYDRLVAEAVAVAVSSPTVESYAFSCLPALTMLSVLSEFFGKRFDFEDELSRLPSAREFMPESSINFLAVKPTSFDLREGDVHNTWRLIESKYLDLLKSEDNGGGGKKQWAITPSLVENFSHDTLIRHDCLQWLDRQPPRSVIYVSFGSSISLTKEEIGAVATGLEKSGKRFIWAAREADRADIFAGTAGTVELPEKFEERVSERGIVVREWAPQMEILEHSSTGGFMTHCGWNSCLESLISGVPVAAWPMHSDQPLNAVLMTEILGAGVMVREWAAREKVVAAEEIERAVERLLSVEGEGTRRKAEELSAAVKKSVEEGGQMRREVESFIAYISR